MPVDLSTIADQLRSARLEKGLSQAQLGEQLGLRQGTISRAERGLDLRLVTLVEIARALDLDLFLAPRRLHSVIQTFVAESGKAPEPAIYTGGGNEPYTEADDTTEPDAAPRATSRNRVHR